MSKEAKKFAWFIVLEALLAALLYAASGLPFVKAHANAVLIVYCIAFAFAAAAVASGARDAAWMIIYWLGPILLVFAISWFFIVGL